MLWPKIGTVSGSCKQSSKLWGSAICLEFLTGWKALNFSDSTLLRFFFQFYVYEVIHNNLIRLKKFCTNISESFDIVCTVHHNQLYEQTNKMHFLCVFILQFFVQLYIFRTTISFIIRSSWFALFCSSVKTMQNCSVLRKTEELDTFAWFVQSCSIQ